MYNESKVIGATARTLFEYMEQNFVLPNGERDYELIFSDDGSTDGSADVIRALDLPSVKVLRYEENKGKGCAVRAAMLESCGDIAMFTDADLAYGTEVIKKMADTFADNPDSDLVIGSRNLTEDGYAEYTLLRKIASKVYLKVLGFIGGFKLSDSQCGCKGFSHEAIQKIFPRCEVNSFAFDFEALLWAEKLGLKITEMPVSVKVHGESKVHVIRDTFKMLKDLRRMRRRISKSTV